MIAPIKCDCVDVATCGEGHVHVNLKLNSSDVAAYAVFDIGEAVQFHNMIGRAIADLAERERRGTGAQVQ